MGCPQLTAPFSAYLLGVVVVFLPRLLLLLLRHLALPPAQPATRGALPITVDPRLLGHAWLGQVALEGEQKATAWGVGGLADPSCPIPLSLRISQGPWGVPGKWGFVYVYGKICHGQSGALGFRHRPGKGFPLQRRVGEEGHLLLPILSGPLEGLFALVRMLWQGHKSTLYFGSWLKITHPTNMVQGCV